MIFLAFLFGSQPEPDFGQMASGDRYKILINLALIDSAKLFKTIKEKQLIKTNEEAIEFGQECLKSATVQELVQKDLCNKNASLYELFEKRWPLAENLKDSIESNLIVSFFHAHNIQAIRERTCDHFYDIYNLTYCPADFKNEFFKEIEQLVCNEISQSLYTVEKTQNALNLATQLLYAFNFRDTKEKQAESKCFIKRRNAYQNWICYMLVNNHFDHKKIHTTGVNFIRNYLSDLLYYLKTIHEHSALSYKDHDGHIAKAIARLQKKSIIERLNKHNLVDQETPFLDQILKDTELGKRDFDYFEMLENEEKPKENLESLLSNDTPIDFLKLIITPQSMQMILSMLNDNPID